MTATYVLVGNQRAISIVLFVNPNASIGSEVTHTWVTGDDGLAGWPSALSQ
jgi:hypothetical protein